MTRVVNGDCALDRRKYNMIYSVSNQMKKNTQMKKSNQKIEFVSYDGEYPNLCHGVLTVKISGKTFRFGHHYDKYEFKTNSFSDEKGRTKNFEPFWGSGGGLNPNYEGAYQEPWCLLESELHNKFKTIGQQLIDVFNENVEFGCCGGCI